VEPHQIIVTVSVSPQALPEWGSSGRSARGA
jgi:hypothetical protein